MKKLTLFILLCFSIGANAQSFGPDRTIFSDPNFSLERNFMSIAFNGWIYNAFNYYTPPYTGYRVDVSKDNGSTWATLIDFYVPGASGWYPRIYDMLVAGTDTTNLRVFLGLIGNGNGGPENFGEVAAFDGLTGSNIGTPISLGDFMTYDIVDVALCSDYTHPLTSSSPYSVAFVYSEGNSSIADSVILYVSNDGGLNFTGPYLVDTSLTSFGRVDISYGSYQTTPSGKYAITYERAGHIAAAFSDAGTPAQFSGNSYIDTISQYTNGLSSNPRVCSQSASYYNNPGDYTTVVIAEVNNPANSSVDLVSFYLDETQNGNYWQFEVIDSTSDNTNFASIDFDSTNANFAVTYYNPTARELPYIYHDMNFPGTWIRSASDYPDTILFLEPFPVVRYNYFSDEIAVSWYQSSDTTGGAIPYPILKYDAISAPLSASTIKNKTGDVFYISPNPAASHINIHFTKELTDASIEVIDIAGKVVYNTIVQDTYPGMNKTIDNGFASGVYYVKINDGKKPVTQKLIIQ